MKTKKIDYTKRAIEAHRRLVRNGHFYAARKLFWALQSPMKFFDVNDYSDDSWTVGHFICQNEYRIIRIRN